jgi:hypothetical protein
MLVRRQWVGNDTRDPKTPPASAWLKKLNAVLASSLWRQRGIGEQKQCESRIQRRRGFETRQNCAHTRKRKIIGRARLHGFVYVIIVIEPPKG